MKARTRQLSIRMSRSIVCASDLTRSTSVRSRVVDLVSSATDSTTACQLYTQTESISISVAFIGIRIIFGPALRVFALFFYRTSPQLSALVFFFGRHVATAHLELCAFIKHGGRSSCTLWTDNEHYGPQVSHFN